MNPAWGSILDPRFKIRQILLVFFFFFWGGGEGGTIIYIYVYMYLDEILLVQENDPWSRSRNDKDTRLIGGHLEMWRRDMPHVCIHIYVFVYAQELFERTG